MGCLPAREIAGGRPGESSMVRPACAGWGGEVAPGQASPLHRQAQPVLRTGCARAPCVRLVARRRTHCANCVRSVQTSATSQSTIRAARGATSLPLLGAIEALRGLSGRAFAKRRLLSSATTPNGTARRAMPAGGDLWGGEERSPDVGARSALRGLTHRGCLNGANAVRAVSSAMRHRGEHRSEVGATRRPPQCEPPAGTACRAAPKPGEHGRRGTSATHQQPPIEVAPRELT